MTEVKKKTRRFDKRDYDSIAEYVINEHERRNNDEKRKSLTKQWDEIDRQLRMEPDKTHKRDAQGNLDRKRAWMPEMELPLQSQTLEVLLADARRMMFPDSGAWFMPHAELTDDYLQRVEFQSLISGDQNDVPSVITQDNADKLVEGIHSFWHRQYNFFDNIDMINAEAFKYGLGVGRARVVKKSVYMDTAKGLAKKTQKIPVLFPRSMKHTFPDDRAFHLMNEGLILGPGEIFEKTMKIADLQMAASKGKKDPEDEDGGWITKNMEGLEGDKHGDVRLLEYEGDLVVPRKTVESMYIPNTIVTIAIGKSGENNTRRVIRLRFRKHGFSSYVWFPYHREDDSAYPTSPLMKGYPIQKAAVDALNRLIMVGALNAQPPISYDKDDATFAQTGGPLIYPGAQWGTVGGVNVEQIGDPTALMAVYQGLLQQYYDVTGVNQPRMGAQTVSHTTAFAKEAELSRGTIRTVDYVRSTLKSAMTKWMDMSYQMGKPYINDISYYIDSYNGFVEVSKSHLPDNVVYEVHGAGGPQEEQAKQQQRLQSLQLAIQLHTMSAQMGKPSNFDINAAIEHVLKQGGWTDIDALFPTQRISDFTPGGPTVEGSAGLFAQDIPGLQT